LTKTEENNDVKLNDKHEVVDETVEKKVEDVKEDETDEQQTQIADKERLIEEHIERYKHLQADFENHRRRSRQEKEDLSTIVAQNLIRDLLPVVDNFERALGSAANQDAAKLLLGIEMIHRQFLQVLDKCGLTTVEALGQMFDPKKHDAVMRVEDETQADGTVVEELQKGYAVRGKIIRPSMVKVVGN